ncbi:MAG: nuclear transport factor 2 family protein [Arachidicoccus sp.]|nr:nuclear transport factor 2 family protein [Arachidicoccus sp.]
MKKYFYCLIVIASFIISINVNAQNKKVKEVEAAVQQLTKAMIDADSVQLYALTYPDLKYAHSTGKVQNQREFVEGITSGRSDFVTIDLQNQTIDIIGNTACVRHILDAKTNDSNVPGHTRLAILLVWAKESGKWKLLARQAVKPQ